MGAPAPGFGGFPQVLSGSGVGSLAVVWASQVGEAGLGTGMGELPGSLAGSPPGLPAHSCHAQCQRRGFGWASTSRETGCRCSGSQIRTQATTSTPAFRRDADAGPYRPQSASRTNAPQLENG